MFHGVACNPGSLALCVTTSCVDNLRIGVPRFRNACFGYHIEYRCGVLKSGKHVEYSKNKTSSMSHSECSANLVFGETRTNQETRCCNTEIWHISIRLQEL